ncbi:MAG: TerB family tellurite resistance protein, partial [Cyanobacteria bacterium J06635_11]
LEEAASKITSDAEKEVALRLSYEVINASARTPDEAKVNQAESEAYQRLITQLNLPSDTVKRAEQEATASLNKGGDNIVDMLAYQLKDYLTKT